MKIKGKQLEDTLRTESAPFDIIYADRTVGDLNGSVRFTALNNSGGTIGAYKVVYITGSSGNLPTIGLADADAGSMPAFGLTTSSSDNGDEVDIVTFGNLKGVDTSTLSVGDVLYVSTTAGEYTITPPTGNSTKLQNIGMVVKSDSNGIIKVGGAGRSNATPNLDEGKFFLGNASNQSVQSGYKLPTTVGTSGQVLTSNGTDVTFQDASGGGGTSYTEVTASISTTDFSIQNMLIPADASSGIVINLPTVKNEYTKAMSYDGDRFIVDNKSQYTVQLYVLDVHNYNTTLSRYEQTYLRHSGNYDQQGVENDGPVTYNIAPMSRVEVEISQLLTSGGTETHRITYNVTATGGMIGSFFFNLITSGQELKPNNIYLCNTSGGSFTVTLPEANTVGDGERIEIKCVHSNTLTVAVWGGSDKIEDSITTSIQLGLREAVTLVKVSGLNYRWVKMASI